MDEVESQRPQPQSNAANKHEVAEKKSQKTVLRRALLVVNFTMMIVGTAGSPLLLRLYFLKGGSRKWLSSWLQTGGCPVILLPLAVSYCYRRGRDPSARPFLITLPLLLACAALGVVTGLDDFLYAYGMSYLPVSTSSLLVSTQLGFTALFAFLLVKQRFTSYAINAVALLMFGAVVLGIHSSGDRPEGESRGQYYAGFVMTLGAAALYGLLLPLVELTYAKAKQKITYTLVMEMQLVMGFFATLFCTVAMLVNKDFQAIPREAKLFELGETTYYLLLVFSAIMWQFFFLGTIGAIFYASALLAGVLMAVLIPVTEVLAVVFFHESFNGGKGIALALSLWGFASYFYGEWKQERKRKRNKSLVPAEPSLVNSTN
ncbi:purine permease 1-like isoform X1 [Iris pallida]|uniref:Probable purine permease n=1 Tax=Iris pallida TaxID=29817 RepID=A0AAX6DQK7_IRIPA|nr:purine permease 1-like isoform X1 [Iris pallida]